MNLAPACGHLAEIEQLRRQNLDLRIALQAATEHGASLQQRLDHVGASLLEEVRERQSAQDKLNKLSQALAREKGDLEIMLQILIDQGDQSAEEGEKARIDGLTQIANRRRFDEVLAQEWDRHLASQCWLSLLICDVDHFKLYNDHYGHQAGDDCLKAVAKAINHSFRSSDLVARYGGEEFGVVLPRTDGRNAFVVAERARLAVEQAAIPHALSPVSDRVSVSIGVASTEPRTNLGGLRDLVEEADKQLYCAKRQGRNRVVASVPQALVQTKEEEL